jgi:hypothetical protein
MGFNRDLIGIKWDLIGFNRDLIGILLDFIVM